MAEAATQTDQTDQTDARCEESSHPELNRTKAFLGGTRSEVTNAVPVEGGRTLADIRALTDADLIIAGEIAMQDIGDNLLVLDELRQRFRSGKTFTGYSGWQDFVARNSRYSMRVIQNKLAEFKGKDKSKVNAVTGNMHTRPIAPVTSGVTPEESHEVYRSTDGSIYTHKEHLYRDHDPEGAVSDEGETLPRRWSRREREEEGGCTLPDLRRRINEAAACFGDADPFAFLGLKRTHKKPTGATQSEALKTRQTLDIPAQWFDLDGKVKGTTNVQWANGAVLNRLIAAVESGKTVRPQKPVPFQELIEQNPAAAMASGNFWEELHGRLNVLVPSYSDGTEHKTVAMLQQALAEPANTKAEKNFRKYVIKLLTKISKDFSEYAQKLAAEAAQ